MKKYQILLLSLAFGLGILLTSFAHKSKPAPSSNLKVIASVYGQFKVYHIRHLQNDVYITTSSSGYNVSVSTD